MAGRIASSRNTEPPYSNRVSMTERGDVTELESRKECDAFASSDGCSALVYTPAPTPTPPSLIESARVDDAPRPGPSKRKREARSVVTSETTSMTEARSGSPTALKPTPFWNRHCCVWSEVAVPRADRLSSDKVPITECGSTWFAARKFFQRQEHPPLRWRGILEPTLPPPLSPLDLVPVVRSRIQKKNSSKPSVAKKPKSSEGAYVKKKRSGEKKHDNERQQRTGKKEKPTKARSPKPPAGKSKRLRIYPNAEQRSTLLGWMGVVRWTYNQAVAAIEKDPTLERDAKALRGLFVTKKAVAEMRARQPDKDFSWILNAPSQPRNEAIADALFAYKSNRAKQAKQGKPFRFRVGFRSRERDAQQCIKFSSDSWGMTGGIYSRLLSSMWLRCCQPLPEKMRYDFSIIHVRATSKFFICIPEPLEPESHLPCDPEREAYHAIALDPGVRTFQTGFDDEGTAIEFGTKTDNRRIFALCQHLDALESRRSAKRTGDPKRFVHAHKKRANMKRAAGRMRERIRNLVDELHKKMALWLCTNYDVVLIPEFQTARMARRREQRCIGNKTARMMYTWAHYRFRQRLLHKAREHRRCRVVLVREDYTSKTCGRCGRINRNLGGAETYRCASSTCGYVAGRDTSAARNILLRFLTEHASTASITRSLNQQQQQQQQQKQQQQKQPSSSEEGLLGPCSPRFRSLASRGGCPEFGIDDACL